MAKHGTRVHFANVVSITRFIGKNVSEFQFLPFKMSSFCAGLYCNTPRERGASINSRPQVVVDLGPEGYRYRTNPIHRCTPNLPFAFVMHWRFSHHLQSVNYRGTTVADTTWLATSDDRVLRTKIVIAQYTRFVRNFPRVHETTTVLQRHKSLVKFVYTTLPSTFDDGDVNLCTDRETIV